MRHCISFILLFLLCFPLYSAISANSVWEVRTTGTDTNGGGFVTGASGTDYSLNNNKNASGCSSCGSSTVNLSTTDAVANGTTTITSATANFSSAIVGNLVYFQGGTGTITAQWRQVTAFTNSTTITIDATIASSTGMTMNIGGALLTISQANTNSVAHNTIYIKAGTYTLTSSITVTLNNNTGNPLGFIGYNTTRGDSGTRPLITTSTNSTDLFQFTSARNYLFRNLSLSNTASTRADGLHAKTTGSSLQITVIDCVFDGFRSAIYGDYSVDWTFEALVVDSTEIKNSTSHGIINTGSFIITNSYIHNNTGDGVRNSAATLSTTGWFNLIINSVLYSNSGSGFNVLRDQSATTMGMINSASVSNTGDGITSTGGNSSTSLILVNSVLENNGGWGINSNANAPQVLVNFTNAYRNNTLGSRNNIAAGTNDLAPSAEVFTTLGSDWSLNNTSGAGALLRSAGTPGAFNGAGTGYIDVGPLQVQATGGGQKSVACSQ